ncbi:hypothetical protein WN51_09797 [Melipona quadrifasciata]|uniref:Uncharacterized protein n=1 Tax=Melipona quadrifasciata TaxID=166423 RepID=A0A0M9A7F3_9HYME|nr:hypothetical protein WN51_09797 [Melipona quadrifasciata]
MKDSVITEFVGAWILKVRPASVWTIFLEEEKFLLKLFDPGGQRPSGFLPLLALILTNDGQILQTFALCATAHDAFASRLKGRDKRFGRVYGIEFTPGP